MLDITPYLTGMLAAYAILLVAASSPGPAVALLVGIATEQGRTPALVATLGISLGSTTINVMTMLGVGIVISQAAWAVSILRVLGVLYLLYLAYGAFNKAIKPPSLRSMVSTQPRISKQFLAGYLLQITNPKAITFWIAIASVGAVDGATYPIVIAYILGAFLISFSCHGAWALALSLNAVRGAYLASRRWIEASLGCLFTFFAYRLATGESS